MIKIELESLSSTNYLIRKWSQVQNYRKNAMITDTTELTINVLYQLNPDLFTIVQKKALWFSFYRDVTTFHEVPLIPLAFRHATSRKTLRPTHPLCVTQLRDSLFEENYYFSISFTGIFFKSFDYNSRTTSM